MFKYFTFLNFLIIINLIIYSQNPDIDVKGELLVQTNPSNSSLTTATWSSLASTPQDVSRSCCALVNVNGRDYLFQFGGGNSSSDLKRVSRLNINNNTWIYNYSTMPYAISSGTAVPMKGDSVIFVFGGNNPTLGKTLRYNVYTNSWQTMANMPVRVTDALVLKYSESLILIIGGGDGYFGSNAFRTNRVQVYNINTNSYSTINNYPINCSMLGGGLYRDTIIAVGGYTDGGNATANCYKGVINPWTLNITWTQVDSYPAGPILRFASYIAVKDNGLGLMCTGGAINGSNPTTETFFYNFCTQNWQSSLPDNSLARSNFKASGRNNIIYVTAGYTTTGVGNTEVMTFTYIDGPCFNMLGTNNQNNSVPKEYYLSQNYPNPFNPVTVIKFGVVKQGNVKIVLYDNTGREIKVLSDKVYNAGNHFVEFDGSNYSSGIYYYKMISGGNVFTKKMVLIK